MVVPIPTVQISMGLVATLLSIPLILRLVPMNRIYGVRTPKAFASERNWYEINAFGGRVLLGFGLFLSCFGWFARHHVPPATSPWAPLFMALPILALAPMLLIIRRFSRRLSDR